jgi:hypothetical protein
MLVPENFGRLVFWNTRVLETCARAASEGVEIDPIPAGNLVDVDELQPAAELSEALRPTSDFQTILKILTTRQGRRL